MNLFSKETLTTYSYTHSKYDDKVLIKFVNGKFDELRCPIEGKWSRTDLDLLKESIEVVKQIEMEMEGSEDENSTL